MNYFWRGGYGRISGGFIVLKLAADSREAALGKAGARYTSTGLLTKAGQHDTNK
jgi:hypothetical protein